MKPAIVLVMALLATAIAAPATAMRFEPAMRQTAFVRSVLTSDHTKLSLTGGVDKLVMTATGHGPDWNRREVFHTKGTARTRNQTSCATWSAQSGGNLQEGLAVRIRHHGGRVRAVTLTKNTIFDVHWIFNVLTWDTQRSGDIWRTVGQFNLATALVDRDGTLRDLPWRVCLRTRGTKVLFKVWLPRQMSEPSWRDPVYARKAELPAGFRAAGRPGWYVGHIPGRGRMVYRNLSAG